MSWALDETVGPYRVIQAIGAGGSARVDLARIERAYGFRRHVVLKRPLEHLRGDAKAAASLRREAALGGRLAHPNLVAVLDAGVHDGYDYLVLEYIHGGSLRTLMEADAPDRVRELPRAVAMAIAIDVARGLHAAHELADDHGSPFGLVHRDVSPSNVLLGLDGTVKLADFGIAKETRVTTLSGSLHGTVTYMAPELCRGHAFDRRADVFSLGVILYELVTGARLFWAEHDVASLHKVLSGSVRPPRELVPGLDPRLEAIVLRALAHDPAARFPTARELADALEAHAAATGELVTARATARWVDGVLGPRDVPWLGAATIPEAPRERRPEGSLVELIAATGDDDAPVDESFGPSTERSAPPVRRAWRLPAVIAGGAAVGIALAAGIALREDPGVALAPAEAPAPEVVRAPAPAPAPPAPAEAPVAEPVRASDPPAPPSESTPVPAERPARPARRTVAARKPAEPAPEPEAAGSGSQAARTKPQWDPTLLLPTDSDRPPKR